MLDPSGPIRGATASPVRSDSSAPPVPVVSAEEFEQGFGEPIHATLDLDSWTDGSDLSNVYSRLEAEVREGVREERDFIERVRKYVFPRLGAYPGAPKGASVREATLEDIAAIHRGLLFNGGVEACDGTRQVHDSLPLTIYQIGIGLVSYQGNQGTWVNRLYRRDLRIKSGDPMDELMALLERREQRSGLNQPTRRDSLSDMAGRGIMAWAERAILLRRSSAVWRLGHGSPAPYELITGSGSADLMIESTRVVRDLIQEHQKFVYVASEPRDRFLLTIGQALRPLQYAVVRSYREVVEPTINNGDYRINHSATTDTTWRGEALTTAGWIERFRDEVAPQVVVGVYRASQLASPKVFYCHQDHIDMAAHIALADSVLDDVRGFPKLIDLADKLCRDVFGGESLHGPTAAAYAQEGAPFEFQSERQLRNL